jgi:hypothetical protein
MAWHGDKSKLNGDGPIPIFDATARRGRIKTEPPNVDPDILRRYDSEPPARSKVLPEEPISSGAAETVERYNSSSLPARMPTKKPAALQDRKPPFCSGLTTPSPAHAHGLRTNTNWGSSIPVATSSRDLAAGECRGGLRNTASLMPHLRTRRRPACGQPHHVSVCVSHDRIVAMTTESH